MCAATDQVIPCPACNGLDFRDELGISSLRYRLCARCGSAHTSTSLDHDAYYGDYFPAGVREDSPILERRYRTLLRQLGRMSPGRRLLEVGCGNGHLLSVAQADGWRASGVELSRTQTEHCQARGLDVRSGDLARDGLFRDREFDAAILIEVVEHLPDPLQVLTAVRTRLVPGGVIYLTTPNFSSVSRRLMGPKWSVLDAEHVVLFTPRGLRMTLGRAGCRVRSVRSRNVNVSELARHLRRGPGTAEEDGGELDRMSAGERCHGAVRLRDRIETSRILTVLKRGANLLLGATGLGDTLVALAVRPREED